MKRGPGGPALDKQSNIKILADECIRSPPTRIVALAIHCLDYHVVQLVFVPFLFFFGNCGWQVAEDAVKAFIKRPSRSQCCLRTLDPSRPLRYCLLPLLHRHIFGITLVICWPIPCGIQERLGDGLLELVVHVSHIDSPRPCSLAGKGI